MDEAKQSVDNRSWVDQMVDELKSRPTIDVVMDLHTLSNIFDKRLRDEYFAKHTAENRCDKDRG